jgi:serine/threonine protein kinase
MNTLINKPFTFPVALQPLQTFFGQPVANVAELSNVIDGLRGQLKPENVGALNSLKKLEDEAWIHQSWVCTPEGLCVRTGFLEEGIKSLAREWPIRTDHPEAGLPDKVYSGDVSDDYIVADLIEEGGFSSVYQGFRKVDRVKVAIKVVDIGNEDAVKSLHREYDLLKKLDGTVTSAVYGLRHMDGKPCLVMERLGRDLFKISKFLPHEINNASDLEKAYDFIRQILTVVAEIHAEGIIHGDIKPENFLKDEDQNHLKLIDFGFAGRVGERDEKIIGTPDYMPPERWCRGSHKRYTHDVFALGVTIYWLLTGTTPFKSESVEGTMLKILDPELKPKSLLKAFKDKRPDLGGQPGFESSPLGLKLGALSRFVDRALNKNEVFRYQSAAEMLQEFEKLTARPAPQKVRASR